MRTNSGTRSIAKTLTNRPHMLRSAHGYLALNFGSAYAFQLHTHRLCLSRCTMVACWAALSPLQVGAPGTVRLSPGECPGGQMTLDLPALFSPTRRVRVGWNSTVVSQHA